MEAEKIGKSENTTEWNEEIDSKINEADKDVRLTKEWLTKKQEKTRGCLKGREDTIRGKTL